MAACTLVFLHSLDTLITFILMTHTYRAFGVGTLNSVQSLFIQPHLWCRCPLLNFKLHVDTEGLGEGYTVNIYVSGQVLDSTSVSQNMSGSPRCGAYFPATLPASGWWFSVSGAGFLGVYWLIYLNFTALSL